MHQEQSERLLRVHEASEARDARALSALAAPRRSSRWLRRADAVCLAVVGVVACYVALYQPALRHENPLLLPRTRQRSEAPAGSSQYITYADIAPAQRAQGYTVKATARGFEVDGRRTLLLGGSVHYPRSTPAMWEDVLTKARHDGLNHVEMYVFWNFHEAERGVFDFAGRRNITRFYELAARLGLFLHVRFGPYVCAEWNNGGLPVWLNWIPGMKVRANNAPWKAEMARFLRHMVALARPFLAENGGPIILAQIENEFTGDDPEYVSWCGDLVRDLNTSIPWVMCNGRSATNTILACNGNDCVEFAKDQTRERPEQPLVWTENEGWYQKWAGDRDDDQRTPSSMAYAVARWFAVGGAAQNYYMYHGGNNYGRAASAGVTTMYADGVNLHADGLSNEPKRSHLRKLHLALISVNDILMANPRQLLYPKPIGQASAGGDAAGNSIRESASSSPETPQRAYVYGDGGEQVAFLENGADEGAHVHFNGSAYFLAGKSVVMVTNSSQILFNTSDVTRSFPHQHRRVYTPIVAETELRWQTWSELLGSRGVPRKQLVRSSPLEQIRVTRDKTDYLTYETSFRLAAVATNRNTTLTLTTCEANSVLVFLNNRYVAEQHLGYPGGNCSKEFAFNLPVKTVADEGDDEADSNVQKRYHLTLVSVSLGLFSLGQDHGAHRKGLTGGVRVNDDVDLAHNGHWKMLPGLVGEQLEVFDPEWTQSVEWKAVPSLNASSVAGGADRVRFPLLAWYRTSFVLPETARPTPGGSPPPEAVSSILLDCLGLTRGRAYVNGHDLGRYWLVRDAADQLVQRYYHVPPEWLHFDNATENLVVVFDELGGSVASVRLVLSTIVEQIDGDGGDSGASTDVALAAIE